MFFPGIAVTIAVLLGFYIVSLIVFRLLLSPLRVFPGPKLAAATFWYEFYYDVVKKGQYTFHIAELHERYGPVIRISPKEIHVKTPEFYDVLHTNFKHRRNKWHRAINAFGIPLSTFGTELHDVHRLRRAAIAPFFSMARVRKLEPMMRERAYAMLVRLDEFRESGAILRIDHYFTAYTTDIITRYAFGTSNDRVNMPDFDAAFHEACMSGCQQVFLSRRFPWLIYVAKNVPASWMMKLNPDMSSYFAVHKDIGRLVTGLCRQDRSEWPQVAHPTFFHELLDSKLPAPEKSIGRLSQEGGSLLAAATVTTSWSLTSGVFWLLREPEALRKLKHELAGALPRDFDMADQSLLGVLENLPYLSATVREMVRMGHVIVSRMARIAPDEDLAVPGTEFVIPKMTVVSMSHLFLELDPDIFPNPGKFWPDRWIEDPDLTRWEVSFGKGSRGCLGRHLSTAEFYLVLAHIFRNYGSREVRFKDDIGFLELWETDESDVECSVDAVFGRPKLDTKGVRCKVYSW